MENNNNSAPKSNRNDTNISVASNNELNQINTSDFVNNNTELMPVSNGGGASRNLRPFTELNQEDSDFALARTLQEQERAYMMLSMCDDGVPYGNYEAMGFGHEEEDDDDLINPSDDEYDGSDWEEDEDAFDVHEGEHQGAALDPSAYPNDEAYARALHGVEERVGASRLLARTRINDVIFDDVEDIDEEDGNDDENDSDQGQNTQDAWDEIDPDEMSYEELIALGEVVGTQSKGLPAETIASLPSVNYKPENTLQGSSDSCVICRCDYEDGETLTVLLCNHSYHSECVNNWLCQNKVCPICNSEVSASGKS